MSEDNVVGPCWQLVIRMVSAGQIKHAGKAQHPAG